MAEGRGRVRDPRHTFRSTFVPFRGEGWGSEKDCHEFPFLRDVELVERSLRVGLH